MDALSDLSLEDLAGASGRWRNIQVTVREAVRALVGVVQDQHTHILSLEAQIDKLCAHVTKQQEQAEATTARLQDLERGVVASVREDRARAAVEAEAAEHRLRSVEEHAHRNTSMLQALEAQVPSLDDLAVFALKSEVGAKASIADVNEALAVKANKDTVDKALRRKANKEDIVGKDVIVGKADWERLSAHMEDLERRMTEAMNEVAVAASKKASKAEVTAAVKDVDRQARASIEEVVTAVGRKVSKTEFSRALADKADVRQIGTEASGLRAVAATQDEVLRVVQDKADAADVARVKTSMDRLKRKVNEIVTSLATKATKEEVQVAAPVPPSLPPSAALHELTDSHERVRRIVDAKADARDVDTLRAELVVLQRRVESQPSSGSSAPLMARLPVPPAGRWLWKTHALGLGGAVPWSTESLNTDPGVLLFTKGSPYITAVRSGLYKISVAFFSPSPPAITVLVGDAPAVSSPPGGFETTTVVHRHPVGNVGGTCMITFLALPERARVSVKYECKDGTGQGMLDVQKV